MRSNGATTKRQENSTERRYLCQGRGKLDDSSYPGFTLIELLVVIAALGILASLLLPVLCRCQQAASTAVCLSNLRQVGVAAATYGADNQGLVPHFWDWLHAASGSGAVSNDITTGTLYPYLKNEAVYLCPTDRSTLGS